MSASLSPIHTWMYQKIAYQERLLAALGQTAVRSGWRTEAQLKEAGIGETLPPMEQVIDPDDIHGSLQGMIDWAEPRLASFVTGILTEDSARLSALEETAFRFGVVVFSEIRDQEPAGYFSFAVGLMPGSGAGEEATELYRKISDVLLNGMPCDRVVRITEQTPDRLSWEYTADLHEPYWTAAGGDVRWFHTLRRSLVRGMLDSTDFTLTGDDWSHCSLVRKSD